jgi:hypothetical protein
VTPSPWPNTSPTWPSPPTAWCMHTWLLPPYVPPWLGRCAVDSSRDILPPSPGGPSTASAQVTCCRESRGPLLNADLLPHLLSLLACGARAAWGWCRNNVPRTVSGHGGGAQAPPFSCFWYKHLSKMHFNGPLPAGMLQLLWSEQSSVFTHPVH